MKSVQTYKQKHINGDSVAGEGRGGLFEMYRSKKKTQFKYREVDEGGGEESGQIRGRGERFP